MALILSKAQKMLTFIFKSLTFGDKTIPAVVVIDSTGAQAPAGTATDPFNTISRSRGPATPTMTRVHINAGENKLLIAANATRRGLALIPEVTNTDCRIDPTGADATAMSMPIPGGWVWNELDPPPATAIHAFSPTEAYITVVEYN